MAGDAARGGLVSAALPVLGRLVEPDETVILSRRFGASILALEVLFGDSPTARRSREIGVVKGDLLPLAGGVTAQALLAFLPRAEIDQLLLQSRAEQSSSSTAPVSWMYRRLSGVRDRGYAASWDEFRIGCGAVAVPIPTESGGVRAALTIVTSAARLDPRHLHNFTRRLQVAAEIIGTRLEELLAA